MDANSNGGCPGKDDGVQHLISRVFTLSRIGSRLPGTRLESFLVNVS